MEFSKLDQIEFVRDRVIHKSAGGFVFHESPYDHILYVALLQKQDRKFFIPKGHLLKNEKPENAAIREVKEELLLKDNPKIIAKLGVDNYIFNLPNDNRLHYKDVHLYVFLLEQKSLIEPLKDEDFINAEWLRFNDALEKISFDKNNLLKARQYFYFNKSVRLFDNLNDIKSISVGIPSYNGSKTIYKTLQSVVKSLNLLSESILKEIIICFDHCTDNTYNIVKDFISKEDLKNIKIKLIYNDGVKGKSTALNKIFSNSLSDFLCFVDDDVILDDKCILNLINAFILEKDLRCNYAKWRRKSLISNNPWKKFWHWIFGVKFDIQPYDKPSEIMRASCMMLQRENFVYMSDDIKNDDQFLQYIYWPNTREIQNAIIFFNSVSSVSDYYKRFIRIMSGSRQLKREFTKERIDNCNKDLYRKIDYKKILQLPLRQQLPFLFYRFIRFFINLIVVIKLSFNNHYEWFRIKQN
ncbi:MAG: glycosyltransferase [Patescibacteria group bacterium]